MRSQGPDLAREARVAGLRRYTTPSLEAVESRRAQLWAVAFVVMAGLAGGLLLLTGTSAISADGPISLGALRMALVGLSAAFVFYVGEKEVHLRRLTRMLVDERVLAAAFSNRLDELQQLSAKEHAVNANLHLDETTELALDGAIDLLGAVSGAVYLRDSDGTLRLHRARGVEGPGPGGRAAAGGVVERVGRSGELALAAGDDDTRQGVVSGPVVAAPLSINGRVDGVLLVRRGPDGMFSEYDARVLGQFAAHAAPAIAHAALFEGEREHVAQLVERDRTKSSYVAMVSHEIKAPLAAIIGAARTMQRSDLPPEHVATFLEMIEKQGERLARLVEDVLDLRKAEGTSELVVRPVDLAAVAREVCDVSRAAGRPVELRTPHMVVVNADPGALEQILFNLIENAFVHGRPPVDVEVAAQGAMVCVSVRDQGAGVAPEDAGQVFAAFARGGGVSARGSGLGLHLVKVLAEAQGGTVGVTARAGGGAEFTVRLPALGPVTEAAPMAAGPKTQTVGAESAAGGARP